MRIIIAVTFTLFTSLLLAQNHAGSPPDNLKTLTILEGTWEANAQGNGGARASGSYTFKRELGGHILGRHSQTEKGCKGPNSFDCDHGDLLYVFDEGMGQPLKAIYFDNEGHVIHYYVTTPTPTSVMFLSDTSTPGPRFRLVYEKKESLMFGKFQMQMPNQSEWKSYLEWSGGKK